jgi:hypothetical protein
MKTPAETAGLYNGWIATIRDGKNYSLFGDAENSNGTADNKKAATCVAALKCNF